MTTMNVNKPSAEEMKVLTMIRHLRAKHEYGPRPFDLARALGAHLNAVKATLHRLRKKKLVRNGGNGYVDV